jgi:hypothetical protein
VYRQERAEAAGVGAQPYGRPDDRHRGAPPKVLLIRGQVELDVVDGIPDEYFQWNGTYEMTPAQRAEWEADVRSLYDGMVRVVVTPTWAKLIDFETTLPSAIEELMREREERQRG